MTAFCTKCGVRVDVESDHEGCPRCHFDTVVALPSEDRDNRCPWCGEDCPRWGRETCPFRPRQLPRLSEESRQLWSASCKQDLQDVLAEVRAQAEPVVDDEILALAKLACTPADKTSEPSMIGCADSHSSEEPRQPRPSEDKLHAVAKRYHQLREDCRRLEKTRDRWQRSMALDSLREDLERVTDDLRLAADEYGRDAG